MMMTYRSFKKVVFIALMLVTCAWANGLTVTNVQRLAAPNRSKISFNLTWYNSWYVTGLPANHDAAWVFIKYRACGDTGPWQHALLSTTMSDHTLNASLAFARNITTTDRLGNAGAHNTGALIRRANTGTGHNVNLACTLHVAGGSGSVAFDAATEYDIRVIGIEMVQIVQGEYTAGDFTSASRFYRNSGDGTPVPISTEGAVSLFDPTCGQKTIPANFPKGFSEFYLMKYEISQGQYVDFLNTLSTVQSNTRFPNAFGSNKHTITVSGTEYVANQKDLACNFISYTDVLSYLDWAALRPMTELEYEKACKGFGAHAPGGFAWGTTTLFEALELRLPEAGADTVITLSGNVPNAHVAGYYDCCGGAPYNTISCNCNHPIYTRNASNTLGYSGYGPIGCGIFARDNSLTREQTGATYFGVMEMTGNVREMVVTTYEGNGTPCTQPTYTGVWGDGLLNASGNFDTALWPTAINGSYNSNGTKGGAFNNGTNECRVSDRTYVTSSGESATRNAFQGGRGAR